MLQHPDGLCHPERSEGSVNVSKANCADVFRFFVLSSSEWHRQHRKATCESWIIYPRNPRSFLEQSEKSAPKIWNGYISTHLRISIGGLQYFHRRIAVFAWKDWHISFVWSPNGAYSRIIHLPTSHSTSLERWQWIQTLRFFNEQVGRDSREKVYLCFVFHLYKRETWRMTTS